MADNPQRTSHEVAQCAKRFVGMVGRMIMFRFRQYCEEKDDREGADEFKRKADELILGVVHHYRHRRLSLDYLVFRVFQYFYDWLATTDDDQPIPFSCEEPPRVSSEPLVLGQELYEYLDQYNDVQRAFMRYVTVRAEHHMPAPPAPTQQRAAPAPAQQRPAPVPARQRPAPAPTAAPRAPPGDEDSPLPPARPVELPKTASTSALPLMSSRDEPAPLTFEQEVIKLFGYELPAWASRSGNRKYPAWSVPLPGGIQREHIFGPDLWRIRIYLCNLGIEADQGMNWLALDAKRFYGTEERRRSPLEDVLLPRCMWKAYAALTRWVELMSKEKTYISLCAYLDSEANLSVWDLSSIASKREAINCIKHWQLVGVGHIAGLSVHGTGAPIAKEEHRIRSGEPGQQGQFPKMGNLGEVATTAEKPSSSGTKPEELVANNDAMPEKSEATAEKPAASSGTKSEKSVETAEKPAVSNTATPGRSVETAVYSESPRAEKAIREFKVAVGKAKMDGESLDRLQGTAWRILLCLLNYLNTMELQILTAEMAFEMHDAFFAETYSSDPDSHPVSIWFGSVYMLLEKRARERAPHESRGNVKPRG
ncbi:hypothetical protein C8A00DRAFT_31121 [Chaetomidium leptoderma]|uniref:Uncharacterized protein n=1 Tax=Chaetomidium leptoderma TaxID=669021 RepID=A0AAN6VRI4_9PEZI|nr:hypothetical protein C8A00DRAFT_31121 [Chaetomidium leptoderma]